MNSVVARIETLRRVAIWTWILIGILVLVVHCLGASTATATVTPATMRVPV